MSRFFPIAPPPKNPETPQEAYRDSATWAHRLFRDLSLELGGNPIQITEDGELELVGGVTEVAPDFVPTKWLKVVVDGDNYYLPLYKEL
jgi:hypothetical protein